MSEQKMRGMEFCGWCVRAFLGGAKTQTRRVIKLPSCDFPFRFYGRHPRTRDWMWGEEDYPEEGTFIVNPRYQAGDIIYAKEALRRAEGFSWAQYQAIAPSDEGHPPVIVGDGGILPWRWQVNKLASRYMPKQAARIFRRIKRVWPERLQDISLADAIAEGTGHAMPDLLSVTEPPSPLPGHEAFRWLDGYRILWNELNGKKHPWASNPWVWAYEFEEVSGEPEQKRD